MEEWQSLGGGKPTVKAFCDDGFLRVLVVTLGVVIWRNIQLR